MAWTVPVALEDAVRAAARAVVGDVALGSAALARAIVDRSKRYTSDRDRLATPTDRNADLAARAAFFTIADAMKIAIPLAELAARDALPTRSPLRILDVGAGCGAMTLGLLATLEASDRRLEILMTDHDSAALQIAAAAVRAFGASRGFELTVATTTLDVTRAALPAADLIVMGTVLNELPLVDAIALVERALDAIPDDGSVIAIEPALRATTRDLHAVRDAILGRGRGHVFAPCTRRVAPCPALADPDDWCHEDRALVLAPRTAELARVTHLRDSGMKFSYLVLRTQPLALVEPAPEATAWRVVSAPFVAKGKLELIGCSTNGRVTLRLLKRHRTSKNRDFEKADRGDVLVVATTPAPDDRPEDGVRVEILDSTAVTRVRR